MDRNKFSEMIDSERDLKKALRMTELYNALYIRDEWEDTHSTERSIEEISFDVFQVAVGNTIYFVSRPAAKVVLGICDVAEDGCTLILRAA